MGMKEDRIYLEGLLTDDPTSGLYDYPANIVKNIWGNIVREGQEKYGERESELTINEKKDRLRNMTTPTTVEEIFPAIKNTPTNATTSDINVDVKNAIDNNKVNQDYQTGLLSDKVNRMNYLFPGTLDISNKDLINAAILRGSLEILKPRQPGENFASQASRALEAGLKTQTGVQALKIADAKSRTTGTNRVSELNFLDKYRDSLWPTLSKVGIFKDKFLFEKGSSFDNAFGSLVHSVYRRAGFDEADKFQNKIADNFKNLVEDGDRLGFTKTGDPTIDRTLEHLVNIYNANVDKPPPKNEEESEESSILGLDFSSW